MGGCNVLVGVAHRCRQQLGYSHALAQQQALLAAQELMSAPATVVSALVALLLSLLVLALLNAVSQWVNVNAVIVSRTDGAAHDLDIFSTAELDQLSTSTRETVFGTKWPNPWGRSVEAITEQHMLVYANLLRDRASVATMGAEIVVLVSSGAFGASAGKMTFAGGPDLDDSAMWAALAALLVLGASVLVKVLLVPEWGAAAAKFEALAVERAASRSDDDATATGRRESLTWRVRRALRSALDSRRRRAS